MARGKRWATFGFMLGVVASVAGNVAHVYHPSTEVLKQAKKTADQWSPEVGAQLGAAFYPVALLVTVEVIARVQWPAGRGWQVVKWVGASLVAGVAAIMSYSHLHGLLTAYVEDEIGALIGPLSVDGLMIVCGFALLAIGKETGSEPVPQVTEPVPWVQVDQPVWWPMMGREPVHVGTTSEPPVPIAGPQVEPSEPDVEPYTDAEVDPELEPLVETARNHFACDLQNGSPPSVRALRKALRVRHEKAAKVRELLTQ